MNKLNHILFSAINKMQAENKGEISKPAFSSVLESIKEGEIQEKLAQAQDNHLKYFLILVRMLTNMEPGQIVPDINLYFLLEIIQDQDFSNTLQFPKNSSELITTLAGQQELQTHLITSLKLQLNPLVKYVMHSLGCSELSDCKFSNDDIISDREDMRDFMYLMHDVRTPYPIALSSSVANKLKIDPLIRAVRMADQICFNAGLGIKDGAS